jgi:hypothetical protein
MWYLNPHSGHGRATGPAPVIGTSGGGLRGNRGGGRIYVLLPRLGAWVACGDRQAVAIAAAIMGIGPALVHLNAETWGEAYRRRGQANRALEGLAQLAHGA